MNDFSKQNRRSGKDRRSGKERRQKSDPRYSSEKRNDQKPKLELDIPKEILNKTTDCDKNFLCLSGDVEHLCKVPDTIGGKMCYTHLRTL